METQNRIKEALVMRNMKQTELADRSGISKGTINNWIKQKYQPKQKSLMILAKILSVSEMWLAGYDVPKERPMEQIKIDELTAFIHRLRKDEKLLSLCKKVSDLSSEQFEAVEKMVDLFWQQ